MKHSGKTEWCGKRVGLCAKCGCAGLKADMVGIYVKDNSYLPPHILCHICWRCMPQLLDEWEVSMPE